jgi:gluconokinase
MPGQYPANTRNVFFLLTMRINLTAPVPAIVIMGVSGCGKSTLGERLAAATGLSFIEGDDLHPKANIQKMSAGQPLTDTDRWPWLEQVAAHLQMARSPGCIISCSALRRVYREFIRTQVMRPVLFILPETTPEILFNRLGARPGHYMPRSLLDSQLATLERPGADEDVVMIDSSRAADVVMEELLNLLMYRGQFSALPVVTEIASKRNMGQKS